MARLFRHLRMRRAWAARPAAESRRRDPAGCRTDLESRHRRRPTRVLRAPKVNQGPDPLLFKDKETLYGGSWKAPFRDESTVFQVFG